MISIGIDPGWVNLGYAVLEDRRLIEYATVNPSLTSLRTTVEALTISGLMEDVVSIERYVAYKGVMNAASEQILMLIGALNYEYECRLVPVNLYRAIEWKPALCKYLFKTFGFRNPSTSFDKKFSIAAAEFIVEQKVNSDHTADAICLAYYGSMDHGQKQKKAQDKTKDQTKN